MREYFTRNVCCSTYSQKTGLRICQDGDSNVNHEIEIFLEIIFHTIIFLTVHKDSQTMERYSFFTCLQALTVRPIKIDQLIDLPALKRCHISQVDTHQHYVIMQQGTVSSLVKYPRTFRYYMYVRGCHVPCIYSHVSLRLKLKNYDSFFGDFFQSHSSVHRMFNVSILVCIEGG